MKIRQTPAMEINDNFFQQAVSCPLKLYHIATGTDQGRNYLPYPHRNKLRLRDVISLRYENRRFTSDLLSAAEEETKRWLKEENVAICGAVLRSGNFITRIPILVKEGDQYTIVQVHGKLRKRSQKETIQWPVKSRSTAVYLLKAAYRTGILKKCINTNEIRIALFFPDKSYRSGYDGLLQKMTDVRSKNPSAVLIEESEKLFTGVDATDAVSHVLDGLPESVSHNLFTGKTIKECCDLIDCHEWSLGNQFDVKIHKECKYCEYRRIASKRDGGCWNEFFLDERVSYPERHVFELIGHGSDSDSEMGYFYQEQVPYTDSFHTFELIKKYGGDKLTIHQRRMLQLLESKGDSVPKIWIKPGIKELSKIRYPLHFIDFEAATYALPMQRGVNCYYPVYFQFSCHSLFEDGTIQYNEWLDTDPDRVNPHEEFVHRLYSIPSVLEGTIVQYSQFEYRALKYLLKDFKKNSMYYEKEITMLEKIMWKPASDSRFLDLNRIVEEYYYNRYLQGSIGLKQVLKSILTWKKIDQNEHSDIAKLYDTHINLLEGADVGNHPDPYQTMNLNGMIIDDGAAAMNAYLSLKNKLLSENEMDQIPVLLRRYCSLDSYALLILFRHFKSLMNQFKDDEELTIF